MHHKLIRPFALALLVGGSLALATTAARAGGQAIDHVSARPGAPYSAATKVNGVVYLSGQIGLGPDGKLAKGWEAQARQTMENVKALVESQGLSMDDVFKCTVMLADMSHFAAFNPIYKSYFKPGMMPARSAFGAAGLALGAEVEIECMAKAK